MTNNETPRSYRDIMAKNDDKANEYWDNAFITARDEEATANLAIAYNADN